MPNKHLQSVVAYNLYSAKLMSRSTIQNSTLTIWPISSYAGIAEGEIFFEHGFRLRMREELDFDDAMITAYGYEVYQEDEKIYWYDDFPHPNDPSLASTYPHHKHVPPDIKRNRIPAPGISSLEPNLLKIIQEIEELIRALKS